MNSLFEPVIRLQGQIETTILRSKVTKTASGYIPAMEKLSAKACAKCGEFKVQMKFHLRGCTGPLKCNECGRCFTKRSNLLNHREKVHEAEVQRPPKKVKVTVKTRKMTLPASEIVTLRKTLAELMASTERLKEATSMPSADATPSMPRCSTASLC